MALISLLFSIFLLVLGFVLLIKGADVFVEGASSIAGNLKIPKILIGLTIVAFGTSAPEFAVSIKSILAGEGGIVLGNVIGSNILNIFLILGGAAFIHDLAVKPSTSKKELPLLLLLTTLLAVLLSDSLFDPSAVNMFTRSEALIILMFFAIFLYHLFSLAHTEKTKDKTKYLPMGKACLFTVLGIIGIIAGSELVVSNAVSIAEFFHVSAELISLTIIALGTSLPELVTSITATRKGEYDLAIGNVVGSNIFNIGVVLGVPVAIFGDISATGFAWYDIAAMLAAAILLFIFGANDRRISRNEGLVFLACFAIYYGYIILTALAH